MREMRPCNRCGGSGQQSAFDDPIAKGLMAVLSCGASLVVEALDPEPCDACDGTGWVTPLVHSRPR